MAQDTDRDRDSHNERRELTKHYRPRVIVKFHDVPYDVIALKYDPKTYIAKDPASWEKLLASFKGIAIERLFTSATPEQIFEMVQKAQHLNPKYRPPNLLTYFAVRCPEDIQPQAVANALVAWRKVVQTAYVGERPTPDPGVLDPTRNPGWARPETNYLRGAPQGIDAEYAWGIAGGDGGGAAVGLKFVDIEQAWMIQPEFPDNHEDLPRNIPIDGTNQSPDGFGHGTAVLGIVTAIDNDLVVGGKKSPDSLGITPHVDTVRVVSRWRNESDFDTADAILFAITHLGLTKGDVLLLEAQTNYPINNPRHRNVPIEVHDHIFELIQNAVNQGFVVVEAAGNGQENLDDFLHDSKGHMFDRGNVHGGNEFQDSGAIMVSAAASGVGPANPQQNGPIMDSSTNPPKRLHNYGSRIDCFAWGDEIYTTWHDPLNPPPGDRYGFFGDTSGATAIIGGVALAVQGICAVNLGTRLPGADLGNPAANQLRSILSDPTRGATLSANSVPDDLTDPKKWNADALGVMPNLRSIINSLGLAPQLYIRDFPGDTGVPHTGPLTMSPDIILRSAPVADYQAEYGESNAANRDNLTLSVTAVAGQPHSIYVRVRNRGGAEAENVSVKVYWSPAATLVTPTLWTLAGKTIIPRIPKGDILTVSPPISWIPPQAGHFCFVAILGHVADPEPDLSAVADWTTYENLVRNNNNVTWRNFNVVNYDVAMANPLKLPFRITASWDKKRPMQLEVVTQLPPKTMLTLDVPTQYDRLLGGLGKVKKIKQLNITQVRVMPNGSFRSKPSSFPASVEALLVITLPEDTPRTSYDIHIRQLHKTREVGRITWHLLPKQGTA